MDTGKIILDYIYAKLMTIDMNRNGFLAVECAIALCMICWPGWAGTREPGVATQAEETGEKGQEAGPEKVVAAYVTSWSEVMPDPSYVTHVNYAFGHVSETFDGVTVDNPERLKSIVALKKGHPGFKVILSIGGWESGGFSEMVSTKETRDAFCRDCKRVVDEFGLDGIDIDWEYPTSGVAGISSSPKDDKRFTKLLAGIRKAIGPDKTLTIATDASGKFIDFRNCVKYLDFVNIMSYDMGNAPLHHSALYSSDITGFSTFDAVAAHLAAGVPRKKLVVGMPFYGRGGKAVKGMRYNKIATDTTYRKAWSEKSQAPYLAGDDGTLLVGYDDPESITAKCRFIHYNGLRGAMYWEYSGDNETNDLARAVHDGIFGNVE